MAWFKGLKTKTPRLSQHKSKRGGKRESEQPEEKDDELKDQLLVDGAMRTLRRPGRPLLTPASTSARSTKATKKDASSSSSDEMDEDEDKENRKTRRAAPRPRREARRREESSDEDEEDDEDEGMSDEEGMKKKDVKKRETIKTTKKNEPSKRAAAEKADEEAARPLPTRVERFEDDSEEEGEDHDEEDIEENEAEVEHPVNVSENEACESDEEEMDGMNQPGPNDDVEVSIDDEYEEVDDVVDEKEEEEDVDDADSESESDGAQEDLADMVISRLEALNLLDGAEADQPTDDSQDAKAEEEACRVREESEGVDQDDDIGTETEDEEEFEARTAQDSEDGLCEAEAPIEAAPEPVASESEVVSEGEEAEEGQYEDEVEEVPKASAPEGMHKEAVKDDQRDDEALPEAEEYVADGVYNTPEAVLILSDHDDDDEEEEKEEEDECEKDEEDERKEEADSGRRVKPAKFRIEACIDDEADEASPSDHDEEEDSDDGASESDNDPAQRSRRGTRSDGSSSSSSSERDGSEEENEDDDQQDRSDQVGDDSSMRLAKRSDRSDIEDRKKRLERLRQKVTARKQALVTPLRSRHSSRKEKSKRRQDDDDSSSDDSGVEIGGKKLRARSGRVHRLRREGRLEKPKERKRRESESEDGNEIDDESQSEQPARKANENKPKAKNEEELLASLFGDLDLNKNVNPEDDDGKTKESSADSGTLPKKAAPLGKEPESLPWFHKPGALIKYQRPKKVDQPGAPSEATKPTSLPVPIVEKKPISVSIDIVKSQDRVEKENVRPQQKEASNATIKPSQVTKKEELMRKMEELKRKKEELEKAARKKQNQAQPPAKPATTLVIDNSCESDDSASESDCCDSDDDSEDDLIVIEAEPTNRTPPSSSAASTPLRTVPASPFLKNQKGAMIATPSPATPRYKNAKESANFQKQKVELTAKLFKEYNARIFDDQLPADMSITWSDRLTKTAGRTICKRKAGVRSATVELSSKVLTEYKRLRNTLCHELCHAAAWLVDDSLNPPHGPVFYKWARLAERVYSDLDIKTCHNYEIECKYQYQCINSTCGAIIGRHSKSIDLEKKRCGRCMGQLRLLPKLRKDGTPASNTPNAYNLFVKEHYARIQKENAGAPRSEIMKLVAQAYKQHKDGSSRSKPGAGDNAALTGACSSPYSAPRSVRRTGEL